MAACWKSLLVVLLTATLYANVLAGEAEDWWRDPGASHGLLVPPLAFYLAWRRREQIAATSAEPASAGLWLVAAACLTLLVGQLGAEFFLSRCSFVLLLAGFVWTFWGAARLRLLAFPLLLLATMTPIPAIAYNALAAPLQLLASGVATQVAQGLGVVVYQEGNLIHLAGITLGVAEACSGLRSLASLLVMALLIGYWRCGRPRARMLLFLLAPPVAVAANVLRVAGTAVLADYDQQLALGFYHSLSGWLIFLAGYLALDGAARLLRRLLD